MGIVEVIWGADAHIIDFKPWTFASEFIKVPVEALGFGKKVSIREIAVHNTDTIVSVEGSNQHITGFFNCFHVPGGDITASAYKSEIQWSILHFMEYYKFRIGYVWQKYKF